MRIKELKSIAQTMADMATSSRIHEDLSELVVSEKGRIKMCLLREDKPLPNLHKQLLSWWQAQVAKPPVVEIKSVIVDLEYDCSSIMSNRDKTALFDLSATCSIEGAVRTFTASSKNRIWWQARA
jgi:hypothetical protein